VANIWGHQQAQVYMGDEDGVDQVKEEDDGVVAFGAGRTRRWRRSSQEGRQRRQAWQRSDMRRHRLVTSGYAQRFGGFVLKTIGGFASLVLKTGEGWFAGLGLKTRRGWFDSLCLKSIGGGFDRFGPQNRGVTDRRTRSGILKLSSRRSEVEKASGIYRHCRKLVYEIIVNRGGYKNKLFCS
jgi:hypothetical protein